MKFTGDPYMVLGSQDYQCHHGKDWHANSKKIRKSKKEEMMRRLVQPTKKLDCPVTFIVKKVFFYSKYKIEKDTKRKRTDMAKKIKEDIVPIANSKEKLHTAVESLGEVSLCSHFCYYYALPLLLCSVIHIAIIYFNYHSSRYLQVQYLCAFPNPNTHKTIRRFITTLFQTCLDNPG